MNKLGIVRWEGNVTRTEKKRNVCGDLVGKPEFVRPLGRPRHRWKSSIKMGLKRNSIKW